jgi:ABC-type nitrate/sulfonate/bicarbonate transport system substrate-binding protein
MRKQYVAALAGILWLALPASGDAAEPTEIKISYQPGLYWALPFHIATEKGWWAEAGLKPSFVTFPAGVPQMASAPSKSWDVGGTGSVPAVLGAVRFNIITIGIGNDESYNSGLLVHPGSATKYLDNPALLKGQTIIVPLNSTADLSVQSCLAKYGLKKGDVILKNMGPAEIISAMSSGNADLAAVWAPYMYTLEEKVGAKLMCSGKDAGAVVPANLVARGDYAAENPDAVAKFLAVYARAWRWSGSHRAETIEMIKKFYDLAGVSLSDASIAKDIDTRPVYDLAGQLRIMSRASGDSEVDQWFARIGEFIRAGGAIAAAPAPKDYISDAYWKRVDGDPKLKEFANRKD